MPQPSSQGPYGRGPARRAVITGIGVRAPGASGREPFWELLTAGRTATRRITRFDADGFRSGFAGECDFDPVAEGFTPAQLRRMCRATQLALACVREAVADSGIELPAADPHRTGVSLGTALGAIESLELEYVVLSDRGRTRMMDPAQVSAYSFDHFTPSTMAAEVAWEVGAEGPVAVVADGCTAGLDAIGHAHRLIQDGAADVVVAGATDAPVTPIVVACFDAIRATTQRDLCRPFDRGRDGIILAEGAAVFVLEEAGHARRRGARVYAEVAGFATRLNALHMTGLSPEGREMAEAIRQALAEAGLGPESVGYVNAHGTGTVQNDRHETAALKDGLGEHAAKVPISSIKSMVGHSLGAIGSIELAACALALDRGVLPPTANLVEADPECDLDYIPLIAREQRVDTVLSIGSGFGGFQSAVVLARPTAGGAR